MKWLFLGCFLGHHQRTSRRLADEAPTPGAPEVADPEQQHGNRPQPESLLPQESSLAGPHTDVSGRNVSASDASASRDLPPNVDAGGCEGQPRPDAPYGAREYCIPEQQEAPCPRLSLDCGVGVGPSPPAPPQRSAAPKPDLTFACHVVPTPSMSVRDTGSEGCESGILSDASSGALIVRGGNASAALGMGPGDFSGGGSRQMVSRMLRGRASLDALLMFGALVRAADEAGLAVSAIAASPTRLERIESGDLPQGDENVQQQHSQHRKRLQQHQPEGAAARSGGSAGTYAGAGGPQSAAHGVVVDAGSCDDADAAARTAPHPRKGLRWPIAALTGSSSGAAGAAAGAGTSLAAAWGSSGGSTSSAANAAGALAQVGDTGFTFSPPAVTGSVRQSMDSSRALHSDMLLGHNPVTATDAQVLELFMRLVTNCSTAGDGDMASSTGGADRSSNGTSTGAGGGGGGGGRSGRLPVVARSASAAQSRLKGRRVVGSTVGAASPAASAAPSAGAAAQRSGGSAPLFKLPSSLNAARRRSWDVMPAAPSALALAAAAAVAAAGLIHMSGSGRAGYGTSGHSGKLGGSSASRLWPGGGALFEDSGPASMLLVGALSGGLSVGGASATSLIRLPTGSGSIRDVLSRIQHQQQLGPEGTGSSSWSANTGLASLFDVNITAALRRTGAVHTFKRALGGPCSLSRASSIGSQLTGPLLGQDTSMNFTNSLVKLHIGRNSSNPGSSLGVALGSGAAGRSQLGAASTNIAGGIVVGGVSSPHVRRANLSSVSTINSTANSTADLHNAYGGGPHGERSSAGSLAAADRLSRQRSLLAQLPGPSAGPQLQQQLRWFVEQHQQRPTAQPPPPLQHPGLVAVPHPHPGEAMQQQAGAAAAAAAAASGGFGAGARPRGGGNPSTSGLAGFDERGSLSLALGMAAGGLAPAAGACLVGSGAMDAPPPQLGTPRLGAPSGAAAAGTHILDDALSSTWLQPQDSGLMGRSGQVPAVPEHSASLDFSRYSWETEWGAHLRGQTQEAFTFTGPNSFSHGRGVAAALLRDEEGFSR